MANATDALDDALKKFTELKNSDPEFAASFGDVRGPVISNRAVSIKDTRCAELDWAISSLMAGDKLDHQDIMFLQDAADNFAFEEDEKKAWDALDFNEVQVD